MSARAEVLGAVRAALATARERGESAPDDPRSVELAERAPRGDLAAAFVARLEAVDGHVHRVADEDGAAAVLARLVAEHGARRVAHSDDPLAARLAAGCGARCVPASAGRAQMVECDLGITGAQLAIAETGTLGLCSEREASRLASLVPPVHVALLRTGAIVGSLDDALARVSAGGPAAMSRAITFVTGPSRTADIELRVVIGVHGPEVLHVILVEDADPGRIPAVKLISFKLEGAEAPRFGALLSEGREVLDFCAEASGVPGPPVHLDWMDLLHPSHQHARSLYASVVADAPRRDALRSQGAVLGREKVQLLAPVPRPGKFICIGLNYRDHALEQNAEIPTAPLVFSKFATSVCGPEDTVRIPPGCEKLDYEAELGVVIGRRTRSVSEERAFDYVLGYCCINDVSARDFQFADGQWQRGKSCDTFGPTGPFVVTTDELADPHSLRIRLRLDNDTLQDSNTDQLIFNVPALVAYLSRAFTLEPGDVIATGTPPGVGFARKPPIWVRAGDRMEVEIDGLGVLGNPVA